MRATSIGTRLLLVALAGLVLLCLEAAISLQSRSAGLHDEAVDQSMLLAHLAAAEMRDSLTLPTEYFGNDLESPEELCAFVAPFSGQFSAVVLDTSDALVCELGDVTTLAPLLEPTGVIAVSDTHDLVQHDGRWKVAASLELDVGSLRSLVEPGELEPEGLLERRDDIEVILAAGERVVAAWPDVEVATGTPFSATSLPIGIGHDSVDGLGLTGVARTFNTSSVGVGDWQVVVGIDQATVDASLSSARRDAILTVGGGAVVLIALVLVFSRNIAEPIRSMAMRLRSSEGVELPTLHESGPAEVRELARRFNALRAHAIESTTKLAHLAHHDPLTDLFNRHRIGSELDAALAALDEDEAVVLIQVDIEDFGAVNQSYGSDVGDAILVEVARRLSTMIDDAVVGRIGGDEFVVLHLARPDAVRKLSERVRIALSLPAMANGIAIDVSVRVGATVASAGYSADAALREAAYALEEAKNTGGDVVIHDEALRARHVERARIAQDLRTALEHGEVLVALQPIISCADGHVSSVEALARWTHPELGPIGPDVFIGVAERYGLVSELGTAILRKACEVTAAWHRDHPGIAPSVSVNVSPRQLASREFPEIVAGVLRDTGLPASALILEVTESLLLSDLTGMCDRLHLIRGLGVRVAIDDFGTGYSSLSYLTSLPVDTLKIDRSFLVGCESDARVRAVLGAIIDLGHSSGLSVVCEGVETHAQHSIVTALGAELVQGYLHMRPQVAHEEVLAYTLRAAELAEPFATMSGDA